ncbi:hypothetical protein GCM10028798_07630 [Humibacter antri]
MPPERRQAQIVEVAAKHFARDGVTGSSMSAIAREASVTRALVYHYFPGKGALLDAVLRREADRLLAATAPDPALTPRRNLANALVAFFDHHAASAGPVRELYASTPAAGSTASNLAAANHAIQVDRILAVSQAEPTVPAQVAVGGWLAFVENTARATGDSSLVPRPQLIEMCTRVLEAALDRPLPEE